MTARERKGEGTWLLVIADEIPNLLSLPSGHTSVSSLECSASLPCARERKPCTSQRLSTTQRRARKRRCKDLAEGVTDQRLIQSRPFMASTLVLLSLLALLAKSSP